MVETSPMDQVYSFTFCAEDWQRVIASLQNESYQLALESERAQEKGASDYAALLVSECDALNAIANDIIFRLPE